MANGHPLRRGGRRQQAVEEPAPDAGADPPGHGVGPAPSVVRRVKQHEHAEHRPGATRLLRARRSCRRRRRRCSAAASPAPARRSDPGRRSSTQPEQRRRQVGARPPTARAGGRRCARCSSRAAARSAGSSSSWTPRRWAITSHRCNEVLGAGTSRSTPLRRNAVEHDGRERQHRAGEVLLVHRPPPRRRPRRRARRGTAGRHRPAGRRRRRGRSASGSPRASGGRGGSGRPPTPPGVEAAGRGDVHQELRGLVEPPLGIVLQPCRQPDHVHALGGGVGARQRRQVQRGELVDDPVGEARPGRAASRAGSAHAGQLGRPRRGTRRSPAPVLGRHVAGARRASCINVRRRGRADGGEVAGDAPVGRLVADRAPVVELGVGPRPGTGPVTAAPSRRPATRRASARRGRWPIVRGERARRRRRRSAAPRSPAARQPAGPGQPQQRHPQALVGLVGEGQALVEPGHALGPAPGLAQPRPRAGTGSTAWSGGRRMRRPSRSSSPGRPARPRRRPPSPAAPGPSANQNSLPRSIASAHTGSTARPHGRRAVGQLVGHRRRGGHEAAGVAVVGGDHAARPVEQAIGFCGPIGEARGQPEQRPHRPLGVGADRTTVGSPSAKATACSSSSIPTARSPRQTWQAPRNRRANAVSPSSPDARGVVDQLLGHLGRGHELALLVEGGDLHHVEHQPPGEVVDADAARVAASADGREQLGRAVAAPLHGDRERGQHPLSGLAAVGRRVQPVEDLDRLPGVVDRLTVAGPADRRRPLPGATRRRRRTAARPPRGGTPGARAGHRSWSSRRRRPRGGPCDRPSAASRRPSRRRARWRSAGAHRRRRRTSAVDHRLDAGVDGIAASSDVADLVGVERRAEHSQALGQATRRPEAVEAPRSASRRGGSAR